MNEIKNIVNSTTVVAGYSGANPLKNVSDDVVIDVVGDAGEAYSGAVDEGEVENIVKNAQTNGIATDKEAQSSGAFGFLKKAKNAVKNLMNNLAQGMVEFAIGDNYKYFSNIAQKQFGRDAAGMLDLAHKEVCDKEFLNNVTSFENYNDPNLGDMKEYFTQKVNEQFKDYDVNPSEIKGYNFAPDSILSKDIASNPDFIDAIKNNLDSIDSGESYHMEFKKGSTLKESSLHNALSIVDVKNPKFDDEGNLTLYVCDTYDFNKSATDILNKAGAAKMDKKELTPYFIMAQTVIPKETVDELRLEALQDRD